MSVMNMFTKWSFSIEIILKDLDVIGVLLCKNYLLNN